MPMNTSAVRNVSWEPTLKRTCMRARIRDVLASRGLDLQYPAVMDLEELPLARDFNVSRAPIAEARRELEGSGRVLSERYRGTEVRGAGLAEMRESYELRAPLEGRPIELGIPFNE